MAGTKQLHVTERIEVATKGQQSKLTVVDKMTESRVSPETVRIVNAIQEEKDEILSRINGGPPTVQPDCHASIAVLEGWADGLIDTEFVEEYMSKFHACPSCEDNYEFYKNQHENNSRGLH